MSENLRERKPIEAIAVHLWLSVTHWLVRTIFSELRGRRARELILRPSKFDEGLVIGCELIAFQLVVVVVVGIVIVVAAGE